MGGPTGHHPARESGRQYHIGLAPGEVAPNVILVGDPARAGLAASMLDSTRLTRSCREYVAHTGTWRGMEVTILATGMGCDNTEIAVVELLQCRRDLTLIRAGSSGALQPDIDLGELVVSTGAVRLENTSLGFVEPGYPALAHHEVVTALVAAGNACLSRAALDPAHEAAAGEPGADQPRTTVRVGVTACAPGFYGWQARRVPIFEPRDPELLDRLARQHVLNVEMETSTLFTLATLAGVRAGAVCAVFANRPHDTFIEGAAKAVAERRTLETALHALLRLQHPPAAADWQG